MRRMKWQHKLTAAELKHIRETTETGTLAQFKRNRKHHLATETNCNECRFIAKKLGLE